MCALASPAHCLRQVSRQHASPRAVGGAPVGEPPGVGEYRSQLCHGRREWRIVFAAYAAGEILATLHRHVAGLGRSAVFRAPVLIPILILDSRLWSVRAGEHVFGRHDFATD